MSPTFCPICDKVTRRSSYKDFDGILYKIYHHVDGTSCKEKRRNPKMLKKSIKIKVCFREDKLQEVLKNFSDDIEIGFQDEDESYDIYFPEIDLAVEVKEISDLDRSMKDNSLMVQMVRMQEKNKHFIVSCYGNKRNFCMNKAEDMNTRNPFSETSEITIRQQLNSYTSMCSALTNCEEFYFDDDMISMCEWIVNYAISLRDSEKLVRKIHVLQRPNWSKLMMDKVKFFRILRGIDMYAIEIAKRVRIKDFLEKDDDYLMQELTAIKGIAKKKARSVIDQVKSILEE